jgi:ribonuclease P protein component
MNKTFKFDITLRTGKRYVCPPVTMFALKKHVEGEQFVQAEFAVPKRIMKKAVHRNRAKRQMRAAYREIMKTITLIHTESIHLIFFYNKTTEQPFSKLKASMQDLIQQFCVVKTIL